MDRDERPGQGTPVGTVLVTGASGLLGSWLRRTAPAGVDLVALTFRRPIRDRRSLAVDLRDRDTTRSAIRRVRPDVVVHAAYAKDEPSIVAATGHVVEAASEVGAAVVHVSTDSVFRGDGRPQPEDADPDPVSSYGRWKAEAEQLVRHADPAATVVRLPLVVSLEPPDHIATAILDGATAGRPTTWFVDEIRQPAMADELAAAIWRIAALADDRRAGTWHLPGPERLTRHEIALRIVAALDVDDDLILAGPAPAADHRPRDLHLGDDRARAEIGWSPRPILS